MPRSAPPGAAAGSENPPSAVELRDLALTMAAAVAERHRAGGTGTVNLKSSSTDPVTDVDRDSERIVTDMVSALRPNDSIFGEEGARVSGSSGVRWIVDPLDGTVNYLYQFPSHAVSIAAEMNSEIVAGVVHDTALDVVYAAALGHGATRDGQPISPNAVFDPAQALVATGFAYDADLRASQGTILARYLPLVRDIRRAGSAALDLCWAACGVVDAYYETDTNLWDVAAGMLVLTEAGGRTSFDENSGRILAAGADLYEPIDRLIAAAEVRS